MDEDLVGLSTGYFRFVLLCACSLSVFQHLGPLIDRSVLVRLNGALRTAQLNTYSWLLTKQISFFLTALLLGPLFAQ
jgi:hypothetical protein